MVDWILYLYGIILVFLDVVSVIFWQESNWEMYCEYVFRQHILLDISHNGDFKKYSQEYHTMLNDIAAKKKHHKRYRLPIVVFFIIDVVLFVMLKIWKFQYWWLIVFICSPVIVMAFMRYLADFSFVPPVRKITTNNIYNDLE